MSARTIMFCDLCGDQMAVGGRAFIKSAVQSRTAMNQMGFAQIEMEHVHVCAKCLGQPIRDLAKLLP